MDKAIQQWAKSAKSKGKPWPKKKLSAAKTLAEKLKGVGKGGSAPTNKVALPSKCPKCNGPMPGGECPKHGAMGGKKKSIDNPHALARWMVARGAKPAAK